MTIADVLFMRKLEKIKKRGEQYKREKELRDMYAEYIPDKKKKRVSNIMLVVVMVAIIAYAAANFALQYFTTIEVSPTLTTCWFAFWGTEIFALAGIKVSKVLSERNSNYFETEEDCG